MNILYIIKEGFSGFRRAKLAAVGSTITVTISLLLLASFYLISLDTSRILHSIREKVEMEAFLQEPLSAQKIGELQREILTFDGIERIRFISKDEAAKTFKREFGEDINKVLDFNPLPPSLRIYLKDRFKTPSRADELRRKIKSLNGIDDVIYRRKMLEFIETQAKTLYYVGLVLGIIISLSGIFLVANTIRLAIYAKRKAVEAMKLVGASRWFIRAPFIIEGLMQGIIGGTIASLVIYYLLQQLEKLIAPELAGFLFVDDLFFLFVVIVGGVLGIFGSVISVKRFIGERVSG